MQTHFHFRAVFRATLIIGSFLMLHASTYATNTTQYYTSYPLEDGYTQPDAISDELWNAISPYFVPEDSEEKTILDSIFMQKNVLQSRLNLIMGGFTVITKAKHKITVMRHPELPGYVLKAYLENSDEDEATWWLKRIRGADAIRDKIEEYGYEGIMKVPHKMVYPLPHYPESDRGDYPKYFILIADDMDILTYKETKNAYAKVMDEKRLYAFYRIITDIKLQEAIYIFNAPFCKDGRIAFIDTELYLADTEFVSYEKLNDFLSNNMKRYWNSLYSSPP